MLKPSLESRMASFLDIPRKIVNRTISFKLQTWFEIPRSLVTLNQPLAFRSRTIRAKSFQPLWPFSIAHVRPLPAWLSQQGYCENRSFLLAWIRASPFALFWPNEPSVQRQFLPVRPPTFGAFSDV